MADISLGNEIIEEVLTRQECEAQAKARYSSAQSASDTRRVRYEWYHRFYAPVDGDQWPEDLILRPNKLHVTANIVKSFVDCEARILALLPRITNRPPAKDRDSRLKGEVIEELFLRYLEQSEWDVWYDDHNRVKSLYGLGILKPFWNPEGDGRPDVQIIDQPQNLMLGFGTSDYSVVDWAIYRYEISPLEAMIRYPELVIENPGGVGKSLKVMRDSGRADHEDPLAQRIVNSLGETIAQVVNPRRNQQTDYEGKMVEVWDYWYRNRTGDVVNAFLVQGNVVDGPTIHPEMPKIPYIVVESDHEPGSAESISTAELLIPIQMGLNRVLSHYAQIVADNSGQAYQLNGENADNVPEGLVPREDEIIAAGGGNTINPINRNTNSTVNMERLIQTYWDTAHKVTRLPEILFGAMPGAQTSGRAMAIQIEAAANRIGPMRSRGYAGLRQLLQFWAFMVESKNPTISVVRPAEVDEESGEQGLTPPAMETFEVKMGDYIKGFNRWKIIAPEITPRDSIENTQNVINMVNAKLISLKQGMDELGIENPEQMISLIEDERSNARLFPQDVTSYAGALQLFQAIEAQQQQNAALAAQEAQGASDQAQAAAQAAAPTGMEDQNQPMTQGGMAPPPGAPAPGGGTGTFEGLIRQTPGGQSQSMSQIRLRPREF